MAGRWRGDLLSWSPFSFTACAEGERSLARTPLARWPHLLPADGCSRHWLSLPAHGATPLSSTIHLNFKFMLVAFYKKIINIKTLLFYSLTKGTHVLKIREMQISIDTLKKKTNKEETLSIMLCPGDPLSTLWCVSCQSLWLCPPSLVISRTEEERVCVGFCEVQGCCLLILCGFRPLLLPLQLSVSYLRLGRHLYQLK